MGIKHDDYTALNNFFEGHPNDVSYEIQAVTWLNFIAERTAEMADDIKFLRRKIENTR